MPQFLPRINFLYSSAVSIIFTRALKNKLRAFSSPPTSMSSLTHLLSRSETTCSPLSLFEKCKSMEQVKQIHSQLILKGLFSQPTIQFKVISFSCKHEWAGMSYARHVFDTIFEPNVFMWNTLIKGYTSCRNYSSKTAVCLYKEMLQQKVMPDNYTFPFLLKGFTSVAALECGKTIHTHVLKFGFDSNVIVQNALIRMYSLCGQVNFARSLFDMSLKNDVVTWNAMISGYNRIRRFNESEKLFKAMVNNGVSPSSVTVVSVLSACSKLKDLDVGQRVHQYVKDNRMVHNLVLDNSLLDLYAACRKMDVALGIFHRMKKRDVISWTTIVRGFVNSGKVDIARQYFDQMPERDSVSWTAMLDGYLRVNQFKEVMVLFREMLVAKVEPDEFTTVSILTACARIGTLELGEWVMAYIDKKQIKSDVYVGNAMIDLYFKCGNVEKAIGVYKNMTQKDKFTWTVMIVGLAINGLGKEALEMLSQMLAASIKPDEITYIGVLCACTHTCLVDKGKRFFASMTQQHGIVPNVTHYGCMVDLLGRAGHLDEAYDIIKDMPMKPNSIVWGALLSACRVHKNVEMAEMVANQLLQLEPSNGAVYVLLSNTYASCYRWEHLHKVRKTMMDRGIRKIPGCSLIEMNGIVHEFVAGEQSHP